MIKFKYAHLLILLPVVDGAWAKDPYVDIDTTMCREGEDIYISCALDGGADPYSYDGPVASICAKANVSPDVGYVQYRYGRPVDGALEQKIEMQFPEKKTPPRGIFRVYSSRNIDGADTALRFSSGKYSYSFESHGLDGYKVVVRNQGREVFNKNCTLPGKNYLIDKAYDGIEYMDLGNQKMSELNE
ncbi:hypothetical protein [Pseudomonas laurylsulfatiphila]|uniref:hypothetical protein n=1 Tax=Pseudomonas laurylsulfatiphila TaxID=2011015 RepID=UPI003D1DEC9B|nr:hypothetical protein [Pseudomonas reinekei]